MTYLEYKLACLDCGLIFKCEWDFPIVGKVVEDTDHYTYNYAAYYNGVKVVELRDMTGNNFKRAAKLTTPCLAYFPLLDSQKKILAVAGEAIKRRIYESLEKVKERQVLEKIKFMEEDFND